METKTNDELRTAWDFVEHTGRSIFLTGKAGTGKTTFLKTVVEQSKKRSIVVAPTGVAAINAGGMTIHSFFQRPFTPYVPNARIQSKFDFGKEKRRIIASLDLLIIDEISMVRSDLLDAIDSVLRRYRDHYKPFGGVQLLMIGDLQQLTPVVTPEDEALLKPYYDTPYFFGSKALQQIEYVTILLSQVFRQEDVAFLDVLNHIREAQPSDHDIAVLNQRYQPAFIPKQGEGYIRLTTHNYLADTYNENELKKLPGHSYTYQAQIEGNFPEYSYPTSEVLTLKEGAQVMFVKNDPTGDHRYYNGRIGEVVEISESRVCVLCAGDAEGIEVDPLEWENAQYQLNPETRVIESKVQGTFRQLPLRLAWAITIHKSQGLTFERAIIDANLSFAPGQVYVALSRCKTLEGMVLARPLSAGSVITDASVTAYIDRELIEAQQTEGKLPQMMYEYYFSLLNELFDFQLLKKDVEYLMRVVNEHLYASSPALLAVLQEVLPKMDAEVLEVSQKFQRQYGALMNQSGLAFAQDEKLQERLKAAMGYFEGKLHELLDPVIARTKVVVNNKQVSKQYNNALDAFMLSYKLKVGIFSRLKDNGFSIRDFLSAKAKAVLDEVEVDEKEVKVKKKKVKEEKPKKEKVDTRGLTYKMFREGKTIKEIAAERSLTVGTVENHLAHFVKNGELEVSEVVSTQHQKMIRGIVKSFNKAYALSDVKNLLPDDYTYAEIKLVIADMEK